MSFMHTKNLVSEGEANLSPDCESIVIACAADNNYAMPLAVTIRSAIENLNDNCKLLLYIIDGGITDFNKKKILKSLTPERCEVEFIQIPDSLMGNIVEAHESVESELSKSKPEHLSIAAFYRLLIPEILPEHFKKVIYLDCDLVIKGDLSQLWRADFGENYVLAVLDTWIPFISTPTGQLNYKKLGLDPNSPYFNSGVLVIDLEKWRASKFSTKAIEYFKKNKEYIGIYDQGVLNALLVGKWGQLDPRWNVNVTSFYDYDLRRDKPWTNSGSFYSEDIYNNIVNNPFVLHFISEDKPWVSRKCAHKEEFFKYVDRTKWSGWRITIWRRLWRKLFPKRRKCIDWL